MAVDNGLHANSTGVNVHTPIRWIYDDATDREAATGFVPADVNNFAKQTDDDSIWILTDDSPITWAQVGGNTIADILDLPTVETDSSLVLAPDGAGGVEFRAETDGGGGLTLQYPPLKPATPTYDFDGAALDAGFTARSNQGSFATTHCITQSPFGVPGSSIAMMLSNQNGGLYVSHADADLDFQVGGFQRWNLGAASHMFGIAALDSSGSGICVTTYTDGSLYFAKMVTWAYNSQITNWGGKGLDANRNPSAPYWFRLKRVSGVWTAYVSVSGRVWDNTFATDSTAYTIDKLYFGMIHDAGVSYYGMLTADYFHVDV